MTEDTTFCRPLSKLARKHPIFIDLVDGMSHPRATMMSEADMENKGNTIYRKSFFWDSMTVWDDDLNQSIQVFHDRFGVFPNICLATTATYKKLELVANQDGKRRNIRNNEGELPAEAEYVNSLASFRTGNVEVEFCINDTLEDLQYILVFDADPGGGGEDDYIIEDDTFSIQRNAV